MTQILSRRLLGEDIVRSSGITQIARETSLSRESLYNALAGA